MHRAVVALAALPLLLAACGGGGSSSSKVTLTPIAYVKQAAAKTGQAPSEHMEMTAGATVQGRQVTMNGNGDFDNAERTGSLQMHASFGGLDVQVDEVVDGTSIYMRSPIFDAALPKGKTWMKIDLQKVGKAKGIDFSALMSQSPTQTFDQLAASGSVTVVGDETIDGAATTHYRGRIDLSKLPQGGKIEKLTHARYGPYDVWIGKDDGYVHRMKIAYSTQAAGTTGRQSVSMTTTFSDFGKDVTVDVPPDAQTFDATDASIKGIGG